MQIKFLNTILILITATSFQYLLAQDSCIYGCLVDSCSSHQDQKECIKNILKELKEVNQNCSPRYKESCVYKYCISDECNDMIDCSYDCNYDLIQILDFKFNFKSTHNNLKNNHHLIKHYEEQETKIYLNSTFIDESVNKVRGHHSHNRRHGINGQIIPTILPIFLIILFMITM
ncbi:hypothetical protein ABPG74_009766 [Tetrahymena malaccensis]